jgi:hypothetical protein
LRGRGGGGATYFHASAGLYMRPWKEKFSAENENFKNVPVCLRIYSFPLDYWVFLTFEEIGKKLGKYVNTSEETLKEKYTSYAIMCIEMDMSGELLDGSSIYKYYLLVLCLVSFCMFSA